MTLDLPPVLNVVLLAPLSDSEIERVRAVDLERLNVAPFWNAFGPLSHGAAAGEAGAAKAPERLTVAELDAVLRDTHVLYMGTPLQRQLPSRLPSLLWGHFIFAGVSNLRGSDWWEAPCLLTTSRGLNHALPLAESAMAAIFAAARGIGIAVRETDRHQYIPEPYMGMRMVSGKTLGIVGLGGIGTHLARLARGCGMRVVASRRSAVEARTDVEGVDVLYPPDALHDLLAESDYVALCAMWTPETEHMLDRAAFAAMKPGAYLVNVARGELIDEDAMAESLESGRLSGAFLDVWNDSFNLPPSARLQSAPNVTFTPHTSNVADSNQAFALELFCDNLQRLLVGEPLVNVIDWSRGY